MECAIRKEVSMVNPPFVAFFEVTTWQGGFVA